jgi:hypothetical protein
VNKLIVGGALGALLIAGQAIASRLPEAPTARAADPKGAESVTTEPGVTPAARAIDRLDPVTTLDPSGAAPVGPLTEAETARLAAQVPAGFEQSSIQISAPFSPPDEVCDNGIDDDRNGLTDRADLNCHDGENVEGQQQTVFTPPWSSRASSPPRRSSWRPTTTPTADASPRRAGA